MNTYIQIDGLGEAFFLQVEAYRDHFGGQLTVYPATTGVKFFCWRCGEIFAKRVPETVSRWTYRHGCCLSCLPLPARRNEQGYSVDSEWHHNTEFFHRYEIEPNDIRLKIAYLLYNFPRELL